VEGDLNLQDMPKLVLISKKSIKKKDNYGILYLCSFVVRNKNKKEE
jgi:hypothetical protein